MWGSQAKLDAQRRLLSYAANICTQMKKETTSYVALKSPLLPWAWKYSFSSVFVISFQDYNVDMPMPYANRSSPLVFYCD